VNNNPLNTIKNFVKQQGSPKELLINFMQRNNSNPMMNNLVNMAKSGKTKQIEEFARNMFKEQGRDFDTEFKQFMQNLNR
jgi:hypothetical protein